MLHWTMNGLMDACSFRVYCWLFLAHFTLLGQDFPDSIPVNQLRVLASHNSYKLAPTPRTMKFLTRFKRWFGSENNPIQLEYSHLPIKQQCTDYHIRGLELDVYNDPKGGHYYRHRLNFLIPKQRVKEREYLPMKLPGFKVLHIPDVDYRTHYLTLVSALEEIDEWSLANPKHAPIFVNLELKTTALGDESKILRHLGFARAIPFSANDLSMLDSLLGQHLTTLYAASELKEGFSSLRERITLKSWPTLGEVRGRVFVIIEADASMAYPVNRNAFVYGNTHDPNCLFLLFNDPIKPQEEITELIQTYIVRTRADAGTWEARNNQYERLKAALLSGAQIISTDYYRPDNSLGKYFVPFLGFVK